MCVSVFELWISERILVFFGRDPTKNSDSVINI